MFLDFDRFKNINDSLGHDVGDALLQSIAGRLQNQIRSVDSVSRDAIGHTAARLGGDEFVVLLDEVHRHEDAQLVADRLLSALAKPYQLDKYEVHSTASMGIVVGDPSYQRAEDVLRDADTAMYEAKRLGRGRYVVFDASMRERVQRRLYLENDLRKAISEQQLLLTYQPIVSLSTGELVSVEALVRWKHPAEGLISPGEFIPIAEESDLILILDQWVLREGCRQLAEWQAALGAAAPATLSINVSRKRLARPDLVESIRQVVAETGIQPAAIQLEVTEGAFVSDVKAAVQSMKALKALGVKLAIDDFGTGSSSFASLHQFPVDVLKIDRSLLANLEQSKDSACLIQGLAVMVRNLGITMVAKGIEKPGEVTALQALGCDYGQGFFFAKPMSASQLQTFIDHGGNVKLHTQGAVA